MWYEVTVPLQGSTLRLKNFKSIYVSGGSLIDGERSKRPQNLPVRANEAFTEDNKRGHRVLHVEAVDTFLTDWLGSPAVWDWVLKGGGLYGRFSDTSKMTVTLHLTVPRCGEIISYHTGYILE